MLGRYPGLLLTHCAGMSVQRNMRMGMACLYAYRDPTLSQEAKDVSIYHYVQPVLPETPTQECRAACLPGTKQLRVPRLYARSLGLCRLVTAARKLQLSAQRRRCRTKEI